MVTKETGKSAIDFMSSKIRVPSHKKYFNIFFHLKSYKTNTIIILQLNSETVIEINQTYLEREKTHF